MARDSDDSRPKRTWKERDQAKTTGKRPAEAAQSRNPSGQERYAYSNYKNQLNRLFDQGGIGALVSQTGGPTGAQTQAALEKDLLQQTNPKAFGQALSAHMLQYGLPKDADVLMACLDVTDEKVIFQALQALDDRLQDGTIKRLAALRSRLKNLLVTCDAPKIVTLGKHVLQKLA